MANLAKVSFFHVNLDYISADIRTPVSLELLRSRCRRRSALELRAISGNCEGSVLLYATKSANPVLNPFGHRSNPDPPGVNGT